MQPKFINAIDQICEEKNIPREVVLETVEAALAAAYKKDYGDKDQEVRVSIDEETGEIKAFVSKLVVETVENDMLEITLADAKKIRKDAKLEETVEIEDTPTDFGRIAAQTAKQVIIQRIREAERDIVFAEYKDREGELVNAQVQRIEGSTVIVDLGQASGVLFSNEQVQGERYYIGQRIKVYIVKVEQSNRGPQVVVSRSHPGVIKKLFETEVPEIESGIVVIKSIAREAGFRTKIAVDSTDENVDPVGSCVGQRGIRVQAVMAELGEEKIDIVPFSEDPKEFISNALSPAKVTNIDLSEGEEKKAVVTVKEDQLSLAIGRSGQNVRLAAKLSGWSIDIKAENAPQEDGKTEEQNNKETEEQKEVKSKKEKGESEESLDAAIEVQATEETPAEAVEVPTAETAETETPVEEIIPEMVDNEITGEATGETPEEAVETPIVKEVVESTEVPVEETPVEVTPEVEAPAVTEEPQVEAPTEESVTTEELPKVENHPGTEQITEDELVDEINADSEEDAKK